MRPKFDPTITFGNLLSLVGLVATVMFVYATLEGKVAFNTERVNKLEAAFARVPERLAVIETHIQVIRESVDEEYADPRRNRP